MRNKMNCEQKYKEALKVMEGLYNIVRYQSSSDALLTSQTIEKAFSELKESEDERIRKQILSFLKEFEYDHYRSLDFSSWIAWLEKQKKSDALINTTSEMEYAKNYSYDVWEKLMSKFNAIAGYRIGCNDVSDIVLNAILNAFEWQNKQKPIEQDTETHDLWVYIREWNDKFGRLPKDEDELAVCIDYVMKRQKPADKADALMSLDEAIEHCKEKSCGNNACALEHKQLEKWLTELKELKEQKHTWSEEDERMINLLIKIFEVNHPNGHFKVNPIGTTNMEAISTKEIVDWLKSLKDRVIPQSKQEQSEEDEKIINDAIWLIEHYATDGHKKLLREQTIDKLKSIKPKKHWKPSEEQMKTLKFAANDYCIGEIKKNLKSLYNDLKNFEL